MTRADALSYALRMKGSTIASSPRYLQIYTALRTQIESAELCSGDKLPPEHELAASHGVSRITIRSALGRLVQDGLIERHRVSSVRLDSKDDLEFQNLLSAVVANAQLAALEITDRVDTANMPELLESVRASLMRTTAVLEQLIWHAARASGRDAS